MYEMFSRAGQINKIWIARYTPPHTTWTLYPPHRLLLPTPPPVALLTSLSLRCCVLVCQEPCRLRCKTLAASICTPALSARVTSPWSPSSPQLLPTLPSPALHLPLYPSCSASGRLLPHHQRRPSHRPHLPPSLSLLLRLFCLSFSSSSSSSLLLLLPPPPPSPPPLPPRPLFLLSLPFSLPLLSPLFSSWSTWTLATPSTPCGRSTARRCGARLCAWRSPPRWKAAGAIAMTVLPAPLAVRPKVRRPPLSPATSAINPGTSQRTARRTQHPPSPAHLTRLVVVW